MANLYEIDQAILDCIDPETGEIVDCEQLSRLTMERDTKVENIALWMKNLKSDIEAYKAEAEAFTARKKSAESKLNSLNRYLSEYLDGKKFASSKVQISFTSTTSVAVAEGAELPEEYRRVTVKVDPDKKAIKTALESGAKIEGCELIHSRSMTIK